MWGWQTYGIWLPTIVVCKVQEPALYSDLTRPKTWYFHSRTVYLSLGIIPMASLNPRPLPPPPLYLASVRCNVSAPLSLGVRSRSVVKCHCLASTSAAFSTTIPAIHPLHSLQKWPSDKEYPTPLPVTLCHRAMQLSRPVHLTTPPHRPPIPPDAHTALGPPPHTTFLVSHRTTMNNAHSSGNKLTHWSSESKMYKQYILQPIQNFTFELNPCNHRLPYYFDQTCVIW